MCVGVIGRVVWCPLAEQLLEHAAEELMTGPAGQKSRRPQLSVNVPAEKTEFRERSTTQHGRPAPQSTLQTKFTGIEESVM